MQGLQAGRHPYSAKKTHRMRTQGLSKGVEHISCAPDLCKAQWYNKIHTKNSGHTRQYTSGLMVEGFYLENAAKTRTVSARSSRSHSSRYRKSFSWNAVVMQQRQAGNGTCILTRHGCTEPTLDLCPKNTATARGCLPEDPDWFPAGTTAEGRLWTILRTGAIPVPGPNKIRGVAGSSGNRSVPLLRLT